MRSLPLTRRHTLAATAALLAAIALGASAQPGNYPNRPVTLLVPTAAGGTTDISARMLGVPLGTALGQPVVVDNRGGGNGAIAAIAVKRAEADGYTLLMQYSGYHVITPLVSKQTPQWGPQDLTAVANVISAPQIVVVRADLPYKTMAEFIAYAKANPGKLNYGSGGNGSAGHLAGEMFKQQAGIFAVHIPYNGGNPAQLALLSGQVDFNFDNLATAAPNIRSGKLKAIAVTTAQPSSALPGVPPVAATLKGFAIDTWWGLVAPAGTPRDVVAKLNQAFVAALNAPETKTRFATLLAEPVSNTPEQFGAFMKSELAKYEKVVKATGAKVD